MINQHIKENRPEYIVELNKDNFSWEEIVKQLIQTPNAFKDYSMPDFEKVKTLKFVITEFEVE